MTRILAYLTGILIFATLAVAAPQIQPLDMQGFKIFRLGAGTVASDAVRMDQAPTSVTVSGTGLIAQTAANTWATRTITGPAAGITVSNGGGVAAAPSLALANDLSALEGLGSTGLACRTGSDTWAQRTLQAPAAGFTITNPAGIAGDPTFVLGNELASLESNTTAGLIAHTASDTVTSRTLTAPAAGFTITNPAGTAGNPTFVLADDLSGLEGMSSTGLVSRTGSGTYANRTLTAPAAGITVNDGNGVSGNPTLVLANELSSLESNTTNGFIAHTAADTVTSRTFSDQTDELVWTNPAGTSGNPSVAFDGDFRAGWLPIASLGTMTYSSATVITTSVDFRDYIDIGDKLELTNSTTKYFYVTALTSSTMTVTGGSDYTLANAAITGYYSHADNPENFPYRFNYSPTLTGFSVNPTNAVYQFYVHHKTACVDFAQGTNGTSSTTAFTATSPITAKTLTDGFWATLITTGANNSAALTTTGRVFIQSGGTTFTLNTNITSGAWTAGSTGKRACFQICYPIA